VLRVVAGLALVVSLVLNFGIVDLVTAVDPSPEWEPVRMLEAGWGIVFGILFPIGFAAQLRRGGGPVATIQQLAVITASLAVATLLTLKAHEWLLVGFWAAVTAAIIALHPARKRVLARPARPDPIIATVAALAVVPAAIYAAQMAAKYRAGFPGDDTNGFEHWTVQAALPLALVGLVALSALKTDGWRVPALSAAIGAVLFGALGVADTGSRGDVPTGWAAATLEWGLVVLLAVATARRRGPGTWRRGRPHRWSRSPR